MCLARSSDPRSRLWPEATLRKMSCPGREQERYFDCFSELNDSSHSTVRELMLPPRFLPTNFVPHGNVRDAGSIPDLATWATGSF